MPVQKDLRSTYESYVRLGFPTQIFRLSLAYLLSLLILVEPWGRPQFIQPLKWYWNKYMHLRIKPKHIGLIPFSENLRLMLIGPASCYDCWQMSGSVRPTFILG